MIISVAFNDFSVISTADTTAIPLTTPHFVTTEWPAAESPHDYTYYKPVVIPSTIY